MDSQPLGRGIITENPFFEPLPLLSCILVHDELYRAIETVGKMARRCLRMYKLAFREKRESNPKPFMPCDLEGENLLDIFSNWIKSNEMGDLFDEDKHLWLTADMVRNSYPIACLLNVESGTWGETSQIRNVETREVTALIGVDDAEVTPTRVALVVPNNTESALYFTEVSNRGSGGRRLLECFRKSFNKKHSYAYMEKPQQLVETQEYLEGSKLREIKVTGYQRPTDVTDGVKTRDLVLTSSVKPKRGKGPLNFDYFRILLRDPYKAIDYVGLDSRCKEDKPDVQVVLEKDGRTKTITLTADVENCFNIQEVLNDNDEDPLVDEAFMKRCIERACEWYEANGEPVQFN